MRCGRYWSTIACWQMLACQRPWLRPWQARLPPKAPWTLRAAADDCQGCIGCSATPIWTGGQ